MGVSRRRSFGPIVGEDLYQVLSTLQDVFEILQGNVQLIVVAKILVDPAEFGIGGSIEAFVPVVVPDHRRAEDRNDPEPTSFIAERVLLPLHRFDGDCAPEALLRIRHASLALGDARKQRGP